MGFFDKLKQSVGIGGAKVEVRLDPGPVPLGGFARGKVVIKGGKQEQECNAVLLELRRNKIVRVEVDGKKTDQTQTDAIASEKLASWNFKINPEGETWFDFAVQVPNEGGEEQRISYEVWASADIPGMIDPSNSVKVPLTKAQEMTVANIPQLLEVADQLRSQSGKDAELEGVLKQILGLDAKNTRAQKLLAETLDYSNPAEALGCWKAYLELVPADVDAWRSLAQNSERRGAYDEGLRAVTRGLELAPARSDLWIVRANLFEGLQKWSDAVESYDKAQAGDAQSARTTLLKAKALIKAERKDDATSALLEAGKSGDPYLLGEVLDSLDTIEAKGHEEKLFQTAISEHPDSAYVWQLRGERLLSQNDSTGALKALDTALDKDVHSEWTRGRLWFLKGRAFEAKSDTTQAKAAYTRALEEHKDMRDAKDRLKALR